MMSKITGLKYRPDIDGLRAVAVLFVIFFHSGVLLSGGYVGVDVFFVISGYLITSILLSEISSGKFTFLSFYNRRILRLAPAFIITLVLVLAFGFIFYTESGFDKLGKDVFFSALGIANIHFAQGIDYFAQDAGVSPLTHIWSLGVEEQFYLIWPLLLLFLLNKNYHVQIIAICFLIIVSISLSEFAIYHGFNGSYYLPHYRAFELLLGAICSFSIVKIEQTTIPHSVRHISYYIGFSFIVISCFIFDATSNFPGLNALLPCIGTVLMLLGSPSGILGGVLRSAPFVTVGLISYPLYLYHQPILANLHFFQPDLGELSGLVLVLLIGTPLSWITYKFVELPIRGMSKRPSSDRWTVHFISFILLSLLPITAAIGLLIAKSNGLPQRFEIFNPFASSISLAHSSTFHANYEAGFQTSGGKFLFIGDSMVQQYVDPISKALDWDRHDIDLVTRGGCVLLKGVNFRDKFADISCNELRKNLYSLTHSYDKVIISQSWSSYSDSVLNFEEHLNESHRWKNFLDLTIRHFENLGSEVLLIGLHPEVEGVERLQPSILSNSDNYGSDLHKLSLADFEVYTQKNADFSNVWGDNVILLQPLQIFCDGGNCYLHDGSWSYFKDAVHISSSSSEFVRRRIRTLLSREQDAESIMPK